MGGGREPLPLAQVEVEDKPKGVAKNLRAKSAHAIPVGPLVLAFQEHGRWRMESDHEGESRCATAAAVPTVELR